MEHPEGVKRDVAKQAAGASGKRIVQLAKRAGRVDGDDLQVA